MQWSADTTPRWGYGHRTVCRAAGEFARDEDGDGFCEVHDNTIEGFWSLLRSWLRPHRGVSQEKLPLYLGFFEFVHNVRKRGKALLGSLISLRVKSPPGISDEPSSGATARRTKSLSKISRLASALRTRRAGCAPSENQGRWVRTRPRFPGCSRWSGARQAVGRSGRTTVRAVPG